ncbi:hypothetical protein JB92DRAFT_2836777 [Gautieria morchelliformis]|nr:hypothetical protein JB92DRAFT_2836777 [Gautieria morchelliformis]
MVPVAPQRNWIFPTLKHRDRHMICIYSTAYSAQRGGMDLAQRHTRLNLRNSHPQISARSAENNSRIPVVKTFLGLKIPQRPLPPTAEGFEGQMRVSNQEWPVEIRIDGNHDEDTMDKEALAATEAANRAFQERKYVEKSQRWTARDAWLEATKLAVWVLRGCRG